METDNNLAVVVLAAGKGTRMRSRLPKVLHPLAGWPLIGHVLHKAAALAPQATITVLRHEFAQVKAGIETFTSQENLPMPQLVEQGEIPGTGKALEAALQQISFTQGKVLVLSGDVPLVPLDLLEQLIQARSAAALITAELADPQGYGRIIRRCDGRLDAIVEQADADSTQQQIKEINTGIYSFSLTHLRQHIGSLSADNQQGEVYLTDLIARFGAAGLPVEGIKADCPHLLMGINDRVQLSESAQLLNAQLIRQHQLAGVTIQDPASTWIQLGVQLAADVTILPGCSLEGRSQVAAGAVIGPLTTLIDSQVGADARVTRSEVIGARIAPSAQVGPYSYLRPGTNLQESSKAGAFVEIKNSTIGVGAKVPHLSYVGDAQVGAGSNIGAGTIFANYDGKRKHPTLIGDGVKVGAGSIFVAPVTVGDGAYTGAGSTIRDDVQADSLALTESKQKVIPGWAQKRDRE